MYNRQKAVDYAYIWWNKRNPVFYNFDKIGGDCTNFVSQCLFFGGIEMDYSAQGWYYKSLYSRSPAWTGVDEFFDYATKNNALRGVKAYNTKIIQMEIGDIVQFMQIGEDTYHHSLIITDILGEPNIENILVTCHTVDAKNKPLSDYQIKAVRFLKILN